MSWEETKDMKNMKPMIYDLKLILYNIIFLKRLFYISSSLYY